MASHFSNATAVKCGGQAVEDYPASLHFKGSLCKEGEPFNKNLLLPCDLFRFTDPMFLGQVIRFDPSVYPIEGGGFDGPGGIKLIRDLRDSCVEPLNHVRGPKYQQDVQRRIACLRNDLSKSQNIVQTCRCQVSLFLRIDSNSMYLRCGKGVRLHQGHARLVDMVKHRVLPQSVITSTMITSATLLAPVLSASNDQVLQDTPVPRRNNSSNANSNNNSNTQQTASTTANTAATTEATTTTVEGILPDELVILRPQDVPVPTFVYPPDHSEEAKKAVEYPARLVFPALPCLKDQNLVPFPKSQITELEIFSYTNPHLKHMLLRFDPDLYPVEPGGFFGQGATQLLLDLRTACDDPLTCHSHAKAEKDKLRRLACRRGQTFKSQHIVQECLCPLKLVLYKDEHSFYFEGGSGCALHQGHPLLKKEAQPKPKKRAAPNSKAPDPPLTIEAPSKAAKRLWNPVLDLMAAADGLPWQQVEAVGRQVQELAKETLQVKYEHQQQTGALKQQQQQSGGRGGGGTATKNSSNKKRSRTTTTAVATSRRPQQQHRQHQHYQPEQEEEESSEQDEEDSSEQEQDEQVYHPLEAFFRYTH